MNMMTVTISQPSEFLLFVTVGFFAKRQALLVRWLTEKDIGIFQLLLLRGSCEAFLFVYPFSNPSNSCKAEDSKPFDPNFENDDSGIGGNGGIGTRSKNTKSMGRFPNHQALGCCLCLRGKPLETWLGTTPLEWKVLFVRALLTYSVLCHLDKLNLWK